MRAVPRQDACSPRQPRAERGPRYNRRTLKLLKLSFGLLLTAWLCAPALAAPPVTPDSHVVVVLPFENKSKAPGIEWIAEAVPAVLGSRLSSSNVYVLSRENRAYAYDRAGIPANLHPSRATLYRVAEQIGADFAILGSYDFDGRNFTTRAQLLDVRRQFLFPAVVEAGPLPKLIDVEAAIAWDILAALDPQFTESRESFVAATPAVRLDAFENYIRGLVSVQREEKIRRFREAVRIFPGYVEAMEELGRTYFEARDYDAATNWLARVPKSDPLAREASFYLGLAAYYRGEFARAEEAFGYLAQSFPLAEVENNLGVTQARRGKKSAIDSFRKAAQADPSDPDYQFNMAVEAYRAGDIPLASRSVRDSLALRPNDGEAKALQAMIARQAEARLQPAEDRTDQAIPLQRIKRNYDENAFRQLAVDVQNSAEARLAQMKKPQHAAYHASRGRELLAKGFSSEAEKEFREALELDPGSAAAHLGMAGVLEGGANLAAARSEAEAALRIQPSGEAHALLGQIALRENNQDAAAAEYDQATKLDPTNPSVLGLQRALAARVAERVNSRSKP